MTDALNSPETTHYLDGGEYVPFAHRYGLTANPEAPNWAARHNWMHHHVDQPPTHEYRHQCRCCGGGRPSRQCCDQRATQEDGLCDQCRDWCVAVDDAGVYYYLADLFRDAAEVVR
jgi:hypothetical protein